MSAMRIEIKDDADFGKAMEAYWKMRGYSDLEKVRAALEAYFPCAIAEAVAAERARNIGIIEGERLGVTSNPADPTDISYDMAIEHCLAAIRSAAK